MLVTISGGINCDLIELKCIMLLCYVFTVSSAVVYPVHCFL